MIKYLERMDKTTCTGAVVMTRYTEMEVTIISTVNLEKIFLKETMEMT